MDTAMKVSPERFAQGMTIPQFVEGMQKNRELFDSNYAGFQLEPSDAEFFHSLGPDINVLVLAEDWCGDVLRYLPTFARVAETVPTWDVRVFRRDENADLADQCLKDGKYQAIPVMKFLDPEMREMTCFVERPAAVYAAEAAARQQFAQEHPELPDAALPTDQMSGDTYSIYVAFIKAFRAANNRAWQQLFVDELRDRLQKATTGR